MSRPQHDGIVRFGDHVSLKHVSTGRYLASYSGDNYQSGSGQQKVFTVDGSPDENSTFIVIPPVETEEEKGYEVGFKDKIRLKRVTDRSNLHSHDIKSPVSGQQEVSCFGNDDHTDENDVWMLEQYDEDDEQYDDFWRVGQPVVLRHVETGKLLHSHSIILTTSDQNEVTAYEGCDDNNKWTVSFD